jgi:serine/threonine protein kinase
VIGRKIAHYEILDTLGQGGMGAVYKARDTQLDRLVAIKVLTPDKVANSDRKARFIQEAKAASALNHPNIVTIHNIGCEDGVDFIVMEFIAGRTLDKVIPKGGLKTLDCLKGGNCASRPEAGQHHDLGRRPRQTGGFRTSQTFRPARRQRCRTDAAGRS